MRDSNGEATSEFMLAAAAPDFSLAGHSALVTGGGSNLGFAMAYALAAHGASAVVLSRNEEALAVAVERLRAIPDGGGASHSYVVGDLTEDATFDRVAALEQPIDILVNNAGGAPRDGTWEGQTADDWRLTLELNVVAANRLCQIVVPGMVERGWGRVVNIASIFGVVAPDPSDRRPGFEAGAYTAAKHAVVGLTKFLAVRLGSTGVTVNAISPGRFPLALDDPARAARAEWTSTPEMIERWAALTPVRRNGSPEDLAGAVVYLASPSSGFMTGHNVVIDGGWCAA